MATSKEIARVEKLWRLAQSPEPHEAASARSEMLKLMKRYGISEDEFGDVTVEVVDSQRDQYKQAIAEFIGLAYRCAALCNARQIAFRGHAGRVQRAAGSYTMLVKAAESCANDPRVMGSPTPVREAWRLIAWMGFVEAIIERKKGLTKPEPPKQKPKGPPPKGPLPPMEKPEEFEDTTVARTSSALDQTARLGVNMDWLVKSAFELGRQVGAGVALQDETTRSEPRGLLEVR